jgi:hypothetical protein
MSLLMNNRRMKRWTAVVAAAAIAAIATAPAARAHELGMFQVYGRFQSDGTYRLDIKVDQEHLPAAQAGGPARATRYGRIAGLDGAVEQHFGRFLSDLVDSMTLSFDGEPVTPTLSMDSDTGPPGGVPRATLRVEGPIPGGAHTFTFRSTLKVPSYPLVLGCEGDDTSSWKWVEGGATSPPFPLASRVVPPSRSTVLRQAGQLGWSAVLPHGPALLLLVAVIFLFARRIRPALLQVIALSAAQATGMALALRGTHLVPPALATPLLSLSVACLAALCLLAPSSPAPSPNPRNRPIPWRTPLAVALTLAAGFLNGESLAAVAALPAWTGRAHLIAAAGFGLGALAAELATLAFAQALIGLPFANRVWYRGRVVIPACSLIVLAGLYGSLANVLG